MTDKIIEYQQVTQENRGRFGTFAAGVFDREIDPARLADCLANPSQMLLLAVCEGRVVGQAQGFVHRHPDKPSELYLDEIGVGEEWRRQGIATGLLEAAFAEGRKRGCADCWLVAEADNAAARALYERMAAVSQDSVWYEFAL